MRGDHTLAKKAAISETVQTSPRPVTTTSRTSSFRAASAIRGCGTNTGVARKYPLPVGPSISKKFARPSALVVFGRLADHQAGVESGRIATATGPMTQTMKRVAGMLND